MVSGSTRAKLNQEIASKIPIPLPPRNVQKRISAILNKQMAAVERARTATEAQSKAAKDLPVAYLRAVFENEEAQRWSLKQLNELGELLPAKSIATEGDMQVTAITTACLTESGFQPLGVKTARMWARDAEICKVNYGEILLARSNTSELVGRASMFSGEPENAVASDLTIRFLPYSLDCSPFLAACLSFLYTTGYWKERAGGASGSMKKITRPQVLQLSIPVPSETVQSKVVGELSEQMQSSQRLMSALSKQLNDIKQLPAAFLRQAFAGKL
jgi:restriction endonuclease S subunit